MAKLYHDFTVNCRVFVLRNHRDKWGQLSLQYAKKEFENLLKMDDGSLDFMLEKKRMICLIRRLERALPSEVSNLELNLT